LPLGLGAIGLAMVASGAAIRSRRRRTLNNTNATRRP
jgi:hypothetical protein